jgi:endonuclease/exonuclease/phosphatase family metal-dependent hydrolase
MQLFHNTRHFGLLLIFASAFGFFTNACIQIPVDPIEPGTDSEGSLGLFEAEPTEMPSQLKVVLFNVMCPLPGGCTRAKLQTIANEIRGKDVVLIQELFWDNLHSELAKMAGYPFYVRGPKKQPGRQTGGGTVILSRFPFESYSDLPFSNCASTDCFASKGAQFARIRIGGGYRLAVVNAHLNAAIISADGVNQTASLQLGQTQQMLEEFKKKSTQGFDVALFGGDLNYSENGYAPNPIAISYLRTELKKFDFQTVLDSNVIDHLWAAGSAKVKLSIGSISAKKLSISDHPVHFADFDLQPL